MLPSQIEFLRHILDEANFVIENTSNTTLYDFYNNEVLKRAVVRSLEIIGEASKKISQDFKQKHNYIEWNKMAGMQNHVIHAYFGIDYDVVWDVCKQKIPEVRDQVNEIISKHDSQQ